MNFQPVTLAIFDVDHTLIKGDSLVWFGKFLLTRRRPVLAEIPKFVALLLGYMLHVADAGDLKASFLKILASGIGFTEMTAVVDQFTESVLVPGMYRQAEDRIRWHREQRHQIVLLSASPAIYLEALAKTLEVDALIATQVKWKDGSLVGDIEGENCKGTEKLKRLLSTYANNHVNWKESYYYADSISDLPVFEKVGHPVLINPDGKLESIGFKRKWRIERWSL
jgi:HAD superfamily hydrolase (TIGR01490 family)